MPLHLAPSKLCRALALLLLGAICATPAAARTTSTLVSGWRFVRADVAGAERPEFVDAAWDVVALPHTWNVADGTTKHYYRGIGWYRTHLDFASLKPLEHAFVRFGAASQSADVYMNGVWLGHHDGGFTAFAFDVTPLITPGRDNVLAVRASNAVNPDLAPVDADFTFFGGLYRPVDVIQTDPVHVSLLDHGASGVYAQALRVLPEQATVKATVVLANDGPKTAAQLQLSVLDQAGQVVSSVRVPVLLEAGATTTLAQELTVARPRLWNGRQDPYLYQVAVELLAAGGRATLDRVTQAFGIRTIAVTPDEGLMLNGRHLELRGVNMHQDWAGKGWALGPAERAADVRDLVEMGANAVRLCHYPHNPATLDLLDQQGVLAWSEIPLVNTVTPTAAFTASTQQQLVEMIRQLYNHPAIAFWGLYNEVKADPGGLVQTLNTLAHAEDPTRLTTAASDRPLGFPLHTIPDTLALNKYDGWYYRGLADFGPEMDAAHAAYPLMGLGVSEYGAGANLAQHVDPPPTDDRPGDLHPEERQSAFHEAYLEQLRVRPYLFGHFVWNLFDFASASRREGGQVGINDKGLVTYDRGVRKDAFFLYKASWGAAPTLYITSRRFTERTDAAATLKVYANLEAVNATLNGLPLGPPTRHAGVIWEWDLRLAVGPNQIKAQGTGPGPAAEADAATWTLAAAPPR